MVITLGWLEKNATAHGVGWTKQQALAIGAPWPLITGWKRQMVGRAISDAQAREFERLGETRRRRVVKNEMSLDLTW